MLQKIMLIVTWLKRYWFLLVILIVAGLWLHAGRREKQPLAPVKELTREDKAMQGMIDALQASLKNNERLIDLHEANTAVIMGLISANHSAIDQDKKRTHEDINRVRTYSADDIKKFFSGLDNVPTK